MNCQLFLKPSLAAFLGVLACAAADAPRPLALTVDGGSVTFDVATNISAVSVHGKSTSVRGLVRAHKDGGKLHLDEIAAALPVEALSTGLKLRDDHMKKYIFVTADQQAPELKFNAAGVACPIDPGTEASCTFPGKLTIRGIERPFSITMKVRSNGSAYRAVGDSVVKLSHYGIERPSQFGVQCADDVKIHLEIQARETVETSRARAGN